MSQALKRPHDDNMSGAHEEPKEVAKGYEETYRRAMGAAVDELFRAAAVDAKRAVENRVSKEEATAECARLATDVKECALGLVKGALLEEKTAMAKLHSFQTNRILLDVGGHKFTTSLQTLTAMPNTYLESLFSGRFELNLDDDGVYFIDRDGTHFRHILNFLRTYPRRLDLRTMPQAQREEILEEAEFYGMLDCIDLVPSPFSAQELIGESLLKAALIKGTKIALLEALAQARALVFEMGSTTPFLRERYQNVRYAITDRVEEGSPVWAADGENFMFRGHIEDDQYHFYGPMPPGYATCFGDLEERCHKRPHVYTNTVDKPFGDICNVMQLGDVFAPTEVSPTSWCSYSDVTLTSEIQSATPAFDEPYDHHWLRVPEMRITVVHGLNDDSPAVAAALLQLAALT